MGIKRTSLVLNSKVTSNAYDATNQTNQLQASEYFVFNEVGIFDTEKGEWIDATPEQMHDPEFLKQYQDDSRYSIALGEDFNNVDGFMNMNDYFDEKDDGLDVVREQNASALEREKNEGITETSSFESDTAQVEYVNQVSNNNIGGEIKANKQLSPEISAEKYNMGLGEERQIDFNGHQATIHKYFDNSTTIYYKDSNGSDVWYRYDGGNNLTDVQIRSGDSSIFYDADGNIKS